MAYAHHLNLRPAVAVAMAPRMGEEAQWKHFGETGRRAKIAGEMPNKPPRRLAPASLHNQNEERAP